MIFDFGFDYFVFLGHLYFRFIIIIHLMDTFLIA